MSLVAPKKFENLENQFRPWKERQIRFASKRKGWSIDYGGTENNWWLMDANALLENVEIPPTELKRLKSGPRDNGTWFIGSASHDQLLHYISAIRSASILYSSIYIISLIPLRSWRWNCDLADWRIHCRIKWNAHCFRCEISIKLFFKKIIAMIRWRTCRMTHLIHFSLNAI